MHAKPLPLPRPLPALPLPLPLPLRACPQRLGEGDATVRQWERLLEFIEPLQRAVLAVPPLALRADPGALLTAGPYLGAMADPRIGLRASFLSGPWSAVLQAAKIDDPFLLRWFDFLAFAFSGLPSDGTVAAAMVYMLAELHKPGVRATRNQPSSIGWPCWLCANLRARVATIRSTLHAPRYLSALSLRSTS